MLSISCLVHINRNSEARASSYTDDGYMSPNNTLLQRIALQRTDDEDDGKSCPSPHPHLNYPPHLN